MQNRINPIIKSLFIIASIFSIAACSEEKVDKSLHGFVVTKIVGGGTYEITYDDSLRAKQIDYSVSGTKPEFAKNTYTYTKNTITRKQEKDGGITTTVYTFRDDNLVMSEIANEFRTAYGIDNNLLTGVAEYEYIGSEFVGNGINHLISYDGTRMTLWEVFDNNDINNSKRYEVAVNTKSNSLKDIDRALLVTMMDTEDLHLVHFFSLTDITKLNKINGMGTGDPTWNCSYEFDSNSRITKLTREGSNGAKGDQFVFTWTEK